MPKTKSITSVRPAKPYPGFPLTPHPTGRWCKKIRRKTHYFGSWKDDREGKRAIEQFNREWPYLSEGRTPPSIDVGDGLIVMDLANAFLTAKRNKLTTGELSPRSFRDYYRTCEGLIAHFGKDRRVDDLRPDDFEGLRAALADRLGVVALKNEVNRVRVVLKFAHDQRLIEHAVSYGQSFDRPSAKAIRRNRHAGGERMFEAAELRQILDALADQPQLRAMVLLAANCGFGNTDCSSLPKNAVDLDGGWLEFPRPKTEIPRRVPLWPETVEAVRVAIASRPAAKLREDDGLVFLTAHGRRWTRASAEGVSMDQLAKRFGALLQKLHINGRRGLGFYSLRHTFETIAGESRDQVAVNAIMGHVDTSMAAVYRERISDDRLRAVVETVHRWLFGA